jgi:hypothetical protein
MSSIFSLMHSRKLNSPISQKSTNRSRYRHESKNANTKTTEANVWCRDAIIFEEQLSSELSLGHFFAELHFDQSLFAYRKLPESGVNALPTSLRPWIVYRSSHDWTHHYAIVDGSTERFMRGACGDARAPWFNSLNAHVHHYNICMHFFNPTNGLCIDVSQY